MKKELMLMALLAVTPVRGAEKPKEVPAEKYAPYFAAGGVIGNGGDRLKLSPEDDADDGNAVIGVPKVIKNAGYIRISGDEGVSNDSLSFTLAACRGTVTKGVFEGDAGACSQGVTEQSSMTVELNHKTRIPPGLYLLSMNSYDSSTERSTPMYHPFIIRIVAQKTTVIPLPKIILPAVSEDMSVSVRPQIDRRSTQRLLIYMSWLVDFPGNVSTCKLNKPYIPRGGLFNWVDEDGLRAQFRESCRQVVGSNWRKMISLWKFTASYRGKEIDTATAPRVESYGSKLGGYSIDYGIYATASSGNSVLAFPGIYRLEFDFNSGVHETTAGVVVGNFDESMIGQVFPK